MIHPTAIIYGGVAIEEDVYIGAYSVIGGPPEHRDYYNGKQTFGVRISKGARIFEHVTIHAGTVRQTVIGSNTAIFNHSHIAHDCIIGDGVTIGGQVSLAGHCHIMDGANISGKSCAVHRAVVGAFAFIGGASFITKHIPPGDKYVGNPARFVGINDVGLSRNGMTHRDCEKKYKDEFIRLSEGIRL